MSYPIQEHSGIPEVRSGYKSRLSPPFDKPGAGDVMSLWPGCQWPEYNGEAAYTISGECERLFCDLLAAMFLGEGDAASQESLEVDALQSFRPSQCEYIQKWIEVCDYESDAIYRGFTTNIHNEETLFVFFEADVMANGLKSGYAYILERSFLLFKSVIR